MEEAIDAMKKVKKNVCNGLNYVYMLAEDGRSKETRKESENKPENLQQKIK